MPSSNPIAPMLPDANRVLSLAEELWPHTGATVRNCILTAADRLNAEERVTLRALAYFDKACQEWPWSSDYKNLHRATWAARL